MRLDKQKTKTRVVFDAICKSRPNGLSLNAIFEFEPGSALTLELLDVLLHFPCFNYAIVGEIEKAFVEICIEAPTGVAL